MRATANNKLISSPFRSAFAIATGFMLFAGAAPAQIQYTFTGEANRDQFGFAVAGAGDVDNDGVPDFIVGAPGADDLHSDAGRATVYSGADGSVIHVFLGGTIGGSLGASVAGAGDFDNDGFADLIVGSPEDHLPGVDSGSAQVFSGRTGALLLDIHGSASSDRLGSSVSGAGDVNNDGFADVIVGAYQGGAGKGYARVYSGADHSLLYQVEGDARSDKFGLSVSGAGDVNNDGFADFVVGAMLSDLGGFQAGLARVFSGADGSVLYDFLGSAPLQRFGRSVSGAGDVNNDGFADVIVGMLNDATNGAEAGAAAVFSGQDGSLLYAFFGDSAGDRFGGSVSGVGDLNNDGFADFAVGAMQDDDNGADAGRVKLYSGQDGSLLVALGGDSVGDRFGGSVSGVGDVNGDNLADFIVGADENGTSPGDGYARVYLGGGTPILLTAPVPGQVGVQNTITVSGAQPGGTVFFFARTQPGITPVPCQGGTVDVQIQNPKHLGSRTANGAGIASYSRNVPTRFAGTTFRVQAIEFESCRFSNIVLATMQ